MRLYLDACSIIYAIEGAPQFQSSVKTKIGHALAANGTLITSRLSRLECRVRPLRDNQTTLLATYNAFFSLQGLVVAELSDPVVERATDIRAKHNFKTPDALHLASAIEMQADAFLTGDTALMRFPGIRVELV